MTAEAGVESATGTMKGVFEKRHSDLESYMNAFKDQPGQTEILVFLDGEPAGFDMLSRDVIHAAFFKMTEEDKAGSMSSLGRRKRFRSRLGGGCAFCYLAGIFVYLFPSCHSPYYIVVL